MARLMLGRVDKETGRSARSSVSYASMDEAVEDMDVQFDVPRDSWVPTGDGGAIVEVDGFVYVLIPAN